MAAAGRSAACGAMQMNGLAKLIMIKHYRVLPGKDS
jgi:hypothetical protein